MRLLVSESDETRLDGLVPQNLKELRDGISDQLTVALFLTFKVKGFFYKKPDTKLPIPQTYSEYCSATETTLKKFQEACADEDPASANKLLNVLIAELQVLPEFSKFSIESDLIDITFSSLSKICTATDDLNARQVAELTLAAYQERGYSAHISETASGFGIFVTNDCIVKNKNIPAGKFLKSLYFIEPMLPKVQEDSKW